jgi:hypothetical protein
VWLVSSDLELACLLWLFDDEEKRIVVLVFKYFFFVEKKVATTQDFNCGGALNRLDNYHADVCSLIDPWYLR